MYEPLPLVLVCRPRRYDGVNVAVQPIRTALGLLLGATCTLMRSPSANVTEFVGSAHAVAVVWPVPLLLPLIVHVTVVLAPALRTVNVYACEPLSAALMLTLKVDRVPAGTGTWALDSLVASDLE